MADRITSFSGPYRFLSNFWPAEIEFGGRMYPSAEHAYQATKTTDPKLREPLTSIRNPFPENFEAAGRFAKQYARKHIVLRPNWENLKLSVMLDCVREKFKHTELAEKLLATGGAELIEGNAWGDRFWGQSPVGKGENHLGKILMQVRSEIRALRNSVQEDENLKKVGL